ncbi:MAG: hypothetical protein RMJ28_06260 [Nitrososphaerota archaeon]|nr:hypothetical protein [Candidatus Calditenuaceae archaeon]MDW8073817.1 hypothetical protein [Nitrososphaerota archaeon]
MVKLIGGVALVRPEESGDVEETVRRILKRHPRVKVILRYWGVEGEFRRPRIKVLWGEVPESIVYREYGVEFELDPASLMFCLGNKFERLRMAATVRGWEVVVDMFAGVGQFSIPIARHARPAKIHSIEINPDAYRFLVKNIERNKVSEIVEPHLGDCREVVEAVGPVADRVLMGYLDNTLSFLPHALRALSEAGGVVHIHSLSVRGREEELAEKVLAAAENLGYAAKLLGWRAVKSYSPSKIHLTLDLFALRR